MTAATVDAAAVAFDPEEHSPLPRHLRLAGLVSAVQRTRAPLPTALQPTHQPGGQGGLAVLFQAELRAGVRAGDVDGAVEAAVVLWRRHGCVDRVHALLETLLDTVARERSAGLVTLFEERRAVATADRVVARLQQRTPTPSGSGVVLVVGVQGDGWDRTAVALRGLAHAVEEAGHPALTVGAPSTAALVELAAADGVLAVVIRAAQGDRLELGRRLAALRSATAGVLLGVCGPGALPDQPYADISTRHVVELLAALQRAECPLTPREVEVLTCVADGLTNTEVGRRLGVAPATVRTHLGRVFEKTGTTHRGAAVAVALRSGWLA